MNNTTRLLKSLGLALSTTIISILFVSFYWWVSSLVFTEMLFIILSTVLLLDLTLGIACWIVYNKVGMHRFISYENLVSFYILSVLRSIKRGSGVSLEEVKELHNEAIAVEEIEKLANFIIKFADVTHEEEPFAVGILLAMEDITNLMRPESLAFLPQDLAAEALAESDELDEDDAPDYDKYYALLQDENAFYIVNVSDGSVKQIHSFSEFLTERREDLEQFLTEVILETGGITELLTSLYDYSEE